MVGNSFIGLKTYSVWLKIDKVYKEPILTAAYLLHNKSGWKILVDKYLN